MLRGVVCLLAAGGAGACATHRASLDAPSELTRYLSEVRGLTPDVTPPPSTTARAVTLESTDASITAAQMQLAMVPTADSHRLLAEAYARRGVLDAAYEHFTQALALQPRDAAALEGRARVWRDWGLPQLGLNDAHRAVYYAPRSASPENTLGTLLLNLGQTVQARLAFERALAQDPSADYARGNLCFADVLSGNGPRAVATCEQARAAQPALALVRTNLALAHAVAGDLPAAVRLMARPGHASLAPYDLGLALLSIGQYPVAATAFDRAVELDPAFTQAAAQARAARRLAVRADAGSGR